MQIYVVTMKNRFLEIGPIYLEAESASAAAEKCHKDLGLRISVREASRGEAESVSVKWAVEKV